MSRDGTDPLALEAAEAALEDGDGSELVGQLIDGRYRLEATLGRGGMGLVYRAAHVGLRRQVAVKILHPSLAASSDVRSRFEREALAVGKIDHPNCVSVYDVGRLPDGSLYLAMELLDGRSLADVLEQEGQLAPGRALHILAGILRGLSHIHAAGLIHRDIKPENVFLIRHGSDEDFAKILDFGIAKPMTGKSDLDDGVKLTQAGMAFGTPIYMAPEQALGNPMDGRADLYAAAVLAYEMLCGQPPFYSDDKLEVMSMHTAKPVPPMRARMIKGGRGVPSSIERLIQRGLTKKPSERYASAEVFLAAVEDALATPDGGRTDVQFERPDTTGSQPLITDDGQVRITGTSDFVHDDIHDEASSQIASAIDEALAAPAPAPAPRLATPPRGAKRPSEPPPPRGGVGLGLPYTGPGGEPIFGLTPAQRLAQAGVAADASLFGTDPNASLARALEPEPPRPATTASPKQRRWVLYAAIAGLAIAAGVAIALLTIPGGSDDDRPGADTPAGEALEALERTELDRALAILEQNKEAIASDPLGQLVLGHVHATRNESEPALVAYAKAMQLDSSLESNKKLRSALRTMAALDKQPLIAAAAYDVWLRTSDEEARTTLLKTAVSENLARRKAVRPVIARHELHAKVDWVVSYALDLQQEPDCDARREAVARLRSLDDPRAIPALQRVIPRKGQRTRNACLLDDANAAIAYLKALSKPASPGAAKP
ncbi:MAG: protein kinase domain-containing protein [Kofleriaceae bacterium]